MKQPEPVIRFEHISMQFPGVLANDDISLDIFPGEVFALIGENGAGKSTLMNILYGIYTPTEGNVVIKGEPVEDFNPKTVIAGAWAWCISTSCWCPPSPWPKTSS